MAEYDYTDFEGQLVDEIDCLGITLCRLRRTGAFTVSEALIARRAVDALCDLLDELTGQSFHADVQTS